MRCVLAPFKHALGKFWIWAGGVLILGGLYSTREGVICVYTYVHTHLLHKNIYIYICISCIHIYVYPYVCMCMYIYMGVTRDICRPYDRFHLARAGPLRGLVPKRRSTRPSEFRVGSKQPPRVMITWKASRSHDLELLYLNHGLVWAIVAPLLWLLGVPGIE